MFSHALIVSIRAHHAASFVWCVSVWNDSVCQRVRQCVVYDTPVVSYLSLSTVEVLCFCNVVCNSRTHDVISDSRRMNTLFKCVCVCVCACMCVYSV